MKLRNLVLAGALFASPALPALAQYAGNPPQVSTPAEKQETRELNRQAVEGTYDAPAMLNGEPSASQSSDSWQRYQISLSRYRQSRAAYERAMARYRAEQERRFEEQAY